MFLQKECKRNSIQRSCTGIQGSSRPGYIGQEKRTTTGTMQTEYIGGLMARYHSRRLIAFSSSGLSWLVASLTCRRSDSSTFWTFPLPVLLVKIGTQLSLLSLPEVLGCSKDVCPGPRKPSKAETTWSCCPLSTLQCQASSEGQL